MLLELEDLETDFAASVPDIELPIVADTDKGPGVAGAQAQPEPAAQADRSRAVLRRLPGCGGDLRAMGEDSDEMLDLVAQAWQVIEAVRPKYRCRT
ncbi:IS66 family transposase zinc-finger binding domain-containing protein [Mesorhizobium sp. Cs1299R1N1]|uniref:IS66 family transposase zinc-finger binding domain-containing protein n=1 Tax=Mesorhizobium sp. Cs1299R1N1 TaxID=3015172 RepID=UPI00301DABD1